MSQAKPPLIASPPPHLLAKRRVLRADFPRGEAKSAKKKLRGNSPWRLATLRGEGGVICGLISFDNGSIVLRPIQHEGGQWCAAPFLFRQDLPNLLVTYGELWRVYIVERGYIRDPERRLALSRLHCIYRQHLCVNEGSRPQQHTWNSKALFFPA